jgi:thiosulfate/3-mercaptopyruvate sulfurtransferase
MNHSKTRVFRGSPWLAIFALASCACWGQEATSDPWAARELLQPAELAQAIQSGKAPILLSVAFPVLYRGKHIVHAINAGPTSKPEGIEALKTAVAELPKDADLVIYCGCCPMVKCPNIRPAYRTLKEMGFEHVRVLNIPTNMHEDWFGKGYPSETGS